MESTTFFGAGFGLDEVTNNYIDPSVHHSMLTMNVTCEELHSRAVPWLQTHRDEPFFMFIHYWDVHWPFMPPEKYRGLFYDGNPIDPDDHSLDPFWKHPLGALARDTWLRTPQGVVTDPDYVVALYDQSIRYLDDGIAALITALDETGLSEETLVIFTADHGESMTEHGIYFDHHGLYDCTLRVPLVARWPGHLPQGARLPHMLQVSDIAPTLLEAVGLPVPRLHGRT